MRKLVSLVELALASVSVVAFAHAGLFCLHALWAVGVASDCAAMVGLATLVLGWLTFEIQRRKFPVGQPAVIVAITAALVPLIGLQAVFGFSRLSGLAYYCAALIGTAAFLAAARWLCRGVLRRYARRLDGVFIAVDSAYERAVGLFSVEDGSWGRWLDAWYGAADEMEFVHTDEEPCTDVRTHESAV